jgi:hypothetical protein
MNVTYKNYFRLDPMNKLLSHSEDFLIKHYAGDVVYTVTGDYIKYWHTEKIFYKVLFYNYDMFANCLFNY